MQSNSLLANLYTGITKRIRHIVPGKDKKTGLTWFKIKFLKHAPPGKVRSYIYKHKKIYHALPSEFLHTLQDIFGHDIYKIELAPGSYIIDCGANIGLSIIYLKEICPDAEIVAFEPDELNFSLLKKNMESFNFNNVTLRKEAVWIEDTQISFAGDGNMGSRIEINTGNHMVKAIRLKNLLSRTVDFLKIDIEGAEYTVLKDCATHLHNVKNLFLEYHGTFGQTDQLAEIFVLLTQAGFSFYIKEAFNVYNVPFMAKKTAARPRYDIQLNIFCFR